MRRILNVIVLTGWILASCVPPLPSVSPQRPSANVQPGNNGQGGLVPAPPQGASQILATPQNLAVVPTSAPVASGSSVDLKHLPIGDQKVSNSPQLGYVWSCQTQFNGNGAFATGPWLNEAVGTYDLTAKPTIDGSGIWPSQFTLSVQGDKRVVESNNLPSHPTGNYPVSQSDDAYNYDRNPNSIQAQSLRLELPLNPSLAAQPECVGGTIGVLLTGALLFNAFDAAGRDAVAHEIQDTCGGHPQRTGIYHYHSLTPCLAESTDGHSPLMGYALDGFGIYGHHGENGEEILNANLDECHGHTHMIEWEGHLVEMYHYHATYEFPYVVGCFRGVSAVRGPLGGGGPQQPGQILPPPRRP